MCGITVFFNKKGISGAELKENLRALKSIKHRGPDGEGALLINTKTGKFWALKTDETPGETNTDITVENYQENSANLFLGHRRLSIIDTSVNGHQPMNYADNYWIVFNGEIYNYVEIKKELETLGYNFKTNSDTEVLLAAYNQWKEKAIPKFNGMFSILIYDLTERKLFVTNDRYGVKPLYHYFNSDKFIFFSEVKQINQYSVSKTINNSVLTEYLKNSYLDYDQSTVFNEVNRFKPSCFANIDLQNYSSELKLIAYYELKLKTIPIKLNEAKENFNTLFNNAINLRLRSDVPLGCSLSGGLDSSSILARAFKNLEQKGSPKLNTFSVVFPGLSGDESEFVKIITDQYNVQPHYVNALDKFTLEDFEKHIYHQDFPVQSTSYYAEWCLARLVRSENVTVLLNGQGGDELLAGYHHHFYRYCRQLILSGNILKYLSQVKKYTALKEMPVNKFHKIILNDIKLVVKFKMGLADLGSSLSNKWAKANSLIEILKLDFTEYMLPTYLRSDDRDFMAFHIETRHPFLDFNLVDFCYSLPDEYKINDGWQKWLLREVMTELPEKIRYRKDKKGYTTPQDIWIKNHKSEFENYTGFLPEKYKTLKNKDAFLKYSLGAWFKVNKLVNAQ